MKLKARLSGISIALGVIPVVVASLVVGFIAFDQGRAGISHEVERKLVSQRNVKKSEIESYIDTLQGLLISTAQNQLLIDSTVAFREAFDNYGTDVPVDVRALGQYYRTQFGVKYQEVVGRSADTQGLIDGLSTNALSLQTAYIANNASPLGAKDSLNQAPNGHEYDRVHLGFHSTARSLLQSFELYDIFIVSPDKGEVIYSTYKELDYATSLINGPYKGSGLADAYRAGVKLDEGDVSLVDFRSYLPSYEAAAAFISTPIVKDGVTVGVLIFQMPVDRISEIMTYGGLWQEAGLGGSGESYLVGEDLKLRSPSRFHLEDEEAFIDSIAAAGMDEAVVGHFKRGGSSLAVLPVESPAVKRALSGEDGFLVQDDYRGVSVVSAYTPVEIDGVNWVLLCEEDEAEAFAAVAELKSSVQWGTTVFVLLAIGVSVVVGILTARSVASPVLALSRTIGKIASEKDFRIAVEEAGDDELRMLAQAINGLVGDLRTNFNTVQGAAQSLMVSAGDLSSSVQAVTAAIEQQNDQCQQQASASTEMEASIEEVARNANATASETQEATEVSGQVFGLIDQAVSGFEELAAGIQGAAEVVSTVDKGSQSIGVVLDVIRGIAEQTNLLALNAAIEAARAGEQGRGFAVVADEVRNLASKTSEATTEIDEMITKLQQESQQAVGAMEDGVSQLSANVEQVSSVRGAIESEAKIIERITSMNIQVATAAEQQTAVAQEISRSASNISGAASESAEQVNSLLVMSEQLNQLSDQLSEIVDSYQV